MKLKHIVYTGTGIGLGILLFKHLKKNGVQEDFSDIYDKKDAFYQIAEASEAPYNIQNSQYFNN